MNRRAVEIELELAEATLRDLNAHTPSEQDFMWSVNRRATIYAVEAEIRRLKAELGRKAK